MGRRALIVWEIGAGRGHVVHLATVAAALRRMDYRCTAYLVHLDHAAEIAPHCDEVLAGPRLPYRQHADIPTLSAHYGDWLGLHHFDDPAVIRDIVVRWRTILAERKPDVLVAEQSPCAILAARSLKIPVAHVGVPATAPPAIMNTFPAYLPEDKEPHYSEAVLTTAVNDAISAFDMTPIQALPQVYASDDEIVASIPLLDCYGPWRKAPLVSPVIGGEIEGSERQRRDVFVYLSTTDRFEPVILTAIASLRLPIRAVLAGNPAAAVALTQSRGARVETQPLTPNEIARTARVVVHAGNHGLTCLGLRAGIPQVTLSEQAEHIYNGRRVAEAGAGINLERTRWTVPAIQTAIRDVWDGKRYVDGAAQLAQTLVPNFAGEPGALTAERIDRIIR